MCTYFLTIFEILVKYEGRNHVMLTITKRGQQSNRKIYLCSIPTLGTTNPLLDLCDLHHPTIEKLTLKLTKVYLFTLPMTQVYSILIDLKITKIK